jgi:outer membrane immunogenic protein
MDWRNWALNPYSWLAQVIGFRGCGGMKVKVLTGLAALTLFDIAAAHAQPAYNWTGYYVGANFGFRGAGQSGNAPLAGQPDTTGSFPVDNTPFSFGPDSGIIGFQGGYNLQVSPVWVLGLEGDFDWGHGRDSTSFTFVDPSSGSTGSGQVSTAIDWSASIRGKVGYTTGPTLLYATGGASFLRATMSGSSSFSGTICTFFDCLDGFATTSSSSFSESKTLPGFVVGTGLEYMLTQRWLLRVEYLFADYGHPSFGPVGMNGSSACFVVFTPCGTTTSTQSGSVSTNLTTQTVRAAISFKFP